MGVKKYCLRVLPLFEDDLNQIVDYIAIKLNNSSAAQILADSVEDAIIKRLAYPEAFEQYKSLKERKYPYYRIYVCNYVVYYVVIDDVMEVRRIIYNKKNVTPENDEMTMK
ncbi:MAG: type II toxin-antitoxin system RelE/ParE family toxin [Bacillota bacterium]|nr:type II toxin-antitoxin system RelE/ParE family toxin [Bacillota bacterium]